VHIFNESPQAADTGETVLGQKQTVWLVLLPPKTVTASPYQHLCLRCLANQRDVFKKKCKNKESVFSHQKISKVMVSAFEKICRKAQRLFVCIRETMLIKDNIEGGHIEGGQIEGGQI
jgi:hypothetical protein